MIKRIASRQPDQRNRDQGMGQGKGEIINHGQVAFRALRCVPLTEHG